MTQKQRLKYSILIVLVVLATMFGLSYLQSIGSISEKTFQTIAIAVAVVVVVLNGIMRRKVKPRLSFERRVPWQPLHGGCSFYPR